MKKILEQINKQENQRKKTKASIEKVLKKNKNFEENLEFYKKIPEHYKNSFKCLLSRKKFKCSALLRDALWDFLYFEKGEKIDYDRFFYFHEKDIESLIEESGYDANISEEDYLKLFPIDVDFRYVFSYEVYQIFLKAREEWVKYNIGYFIHTW